MHIRRAAPSALLLAISLGGARTIAAQDSSRGVAPDSSHGIVLPPIAVHGFVDVFYRSGDATTRDGFRLRKADIKFSGSLSPHVRWRIGFDGAKTLGLKTTVGTASDSLAVAGASVDQTSRILQDAALTYVVNPTMSIDVGQQGLPLGLEGSTSLTQVETIERTNISIDHSRAVKLGDVRDIGASINGRAAREFEYHLGVYNEPGDDQGTTDSNDQKVVIGRLVLHPSLFPNFEIGGTGAYEGGPPTQHRERGGTEAQYKGRLVTLRAETMSARDGLLHRFGWYALGALRPAERVELVGRFDSWDTDRTHESSLRDAYKREIVLGGSYALDGSRAKLALNVIHQSFPNVASLPTSTFLLAAFSGAW